MSTTWNADRAVQWLEARLKQKSTEFDRRYSDAERASGVLRNGYHFTGDMPARFHTDGQEKAFSFIITDDIQARN